MPIDEFKDIYAELKKGVDQTNDLFVEQFNKEIQQFVDSKAERGDKFILPLKWITKTIPEDEKKIQQEAEALVVEKENREKAAAVSVKKDKDKKEKDKKQNAKNKQSKNQKKDQNQNVTEKNNNKLVVENKNNPEPPPKIYNP